MTCFAVKLVDPALGGDGERIPLPGSLVSGSRGAEGVAAIPADRPCPQAYGLQGDSTRDSTQVNSVKPVLRDMMQVKGL